ncbi:hypothetical protein [Flavobacterium sp. GCM10023249]|uniref:hypothetical protein n=1 Tax=unclassified Flavobacterium TaxID=196869 RepID=UPI00361EFB43
MIKKVAALSLVISLTSCVGLSSRDIFTDLRNNPAGASQNTVENCEKTDMEVSLYFESEPINFEYEKIGLIEVQGSDYHNDLDVINKLKALSKSKCCDAIIGIKKNYVIRDSGFLFDKEPLEKYSAITYSGIAVKKKNNVENTNH